MFEAGILVTNAAAANAIPVAEFTLAAILFANKNVFGFRDMYRDRRNRLQVQQFTGSTVGNRQKTIGIVGLSRIGRRVLELLRPFDLDVIVHDPHLADAEAQALRVRNVALDEMMRCCDIVTLHAPALDQTRHMIDARRLALMREGSTLINTARGSLVDQSALIEELSLGRIAAVLDVTDPDVLPAESPLFDLANVLLKPHIAGALGTERERLGMMAVDEVERFARGQPLKYQIQADTLHLQALGYPQGTDHLGRADLLRTAGCWPFGLPSHPDSTSKGILRPCTMLAPWPTQPRPLQVRENWAVQRGLSKRIQIALPTGSLVSS